MKNVPKLRFNGFSDEWEEKRLGDITCLMQSGLSRQLSDTDIGVPVIRSNNIFDGKINPNDIKYWYKVDNQGANLENYYLRDGDLLVNFINSLAQIGKCGIYKNELKRDTIFTTNIMRLNFNKKINTEYIYNYFQLKKYSDYIQSITKPAVNQASFTTVDFKKFKLNTPSIEEQEKIANFLTKVDKLIEKQDEKASNLEQYKKGMMQKIFSQEIRFKKDDRGEYPKWEVKTLGDVFTIPEKIKSENPDKNKLISVKLHMQGVKENTNVDTLSLGATTYYIRRAGQFIYGKQNFFNGAFGIIPYELDGYLSSGDIPSLEINKNKIENKYLLNYIGRKDFYKKTENLSTGTGSKRIHESTLFEVNINLPCLDEQAKIANFLSKIDSIVEKEKEKLEEMRKWKKGLLQQMFV